MEWGWYIPVALKYYLFFLLTKSWGDPYSFHFYSGFSGLFPLAVKSPWKFSVFFLVVLKGGSGVGVSCVSRTHAAWHMQVCDSCSQVPKC